jgi:hypothetical protein
MTSCGLRTSIGAAPTSDGFWGSASRVGAVRLSPRLEVPSPASFFGLGSGLTSCAAGDHPTLATRVDAGGTGKQMTGHSSVTSSSDCCSGWLPLSADERWYVTRTLPQRELQAATQLKNQDSRAFVPRYFKNRRHARKVETISAPLLPRYLFVILNRAVDRLRSINGTLGVERLLMQGGEPLPVPHGVVESLVEAADCGGNVHFGANL